MYDSEREIFGQATSLLQTYDYISSRRAEIEDFFKNAGHEQVVFLGCGSSYWSSLSARVTFQRATGTQTFAITSGDTLMNIEDGEKAYKKPLLITPSRSGSTTETVEVVRRFKKAYDCRTLSITEYPDSQIEGLSDLNLFIPWANETSICQTRSFSCLYLAEVMLGAIAGRDEALLADLKQYLDAADKLLLSARAELEKAVASFPDCSSLVSLGNGAMLGVAIEGAYIAIEMAAFPSNYYPTLELRHGPIVTCGENTLVAIFSGGNRSDLDEGMAKDAKAKGSRVMYIGPKGDFRNCDHSFALGREARPETVALFGIAVMQGFAYLKAVALGLDPDHPAELVSWISM